MLIKVNKKNKETCFSRGKINHIKNTEFYLYNWVIRVAQTRANTEVSFSHTRLVGRVCAVWRIFTLNKKDRYRAV